MSKRSGLRNPLLHFLILGLCIFWGARYLDERESYWIAYPGSEKIQALKDNWTRQTGRLPTSAQVDAMIESELNAEVLFREALRRDMHRDDAVVIQRLLRDANFLGVSGSEREKLAAVMELGVHETDEVVRRRLIQRMEMLGKGSAEAEPTEQELREIYEDTMSRWMVPARLAVSHIFFSVDTQADVRQRAGELLMQLHADGHDATAATEYGDPFLHGNNLPLQDSQSLAFFFGEAFVDELMQIREQGQWQGPVDSAYGTHLVYVREVQEERQKSFDEVRDHLQRLWQESREQQQLQTFIASLRQRYEVIQ